MSKGINDSLKLHILLVALTADSGYYTFRYEIAANRAVKYGFKSRYIGDLFHSKYIH